MDNISYIINIIKDIKKKSRVAWENIFPDRPEEAAMFGLQKLVH